MRGLVCGVLSLRAGPCWHIILQTSMKVEEGVRQLEKAERRQKQSRMVLCIMMLLVAVVIMLLLVVFKAIFL